MNCIEFRQLKLSDPSFESATADEHRDSCETCAQFEEEILSLDLKVDQALSVVVPEGLAARIVLNRSLKQPQRMSTRRVWLSMAASFIAISVISYQFLQQTPTADPLLAHANHKPHEFYGAEHQAITQERLADVLKSINAEGEVENVVYAAICPVDGEEAVHLVIKDGKDQYTVMLLPELSPSKTFDVDDGMWRGYISPHPAGALAVLADSDHTHAVSRLKEMSEKYQNTFYLIAET